MDIQGLQKLTLLDYPRHVATTVFLSGCNMKCPFCHNGTLWDNKAGRVADDKELLSMLKKRKGLIEGVCITGGEPTLRPDLPELLRSIKELGLKVKLDTNGTNPDILHSLIDEGAVDYVAMDIKNSRSLYPATVGIPDFDTKPIEESVRILLSSESNYEFRTTVVRELHSASSFEEIGKWIAGAAHYYLQKFIDRESVPTRGLTSPTSAELNQYLSILKTFIPNVALRGE